MIKHRKGVSNINKKKMLFPVMALAVLAGGLLTVTNASAEDSVNPHGAIVQKIAGKFGLNQNEVQKVFDESRDEHQTEMQKKHEERLNTLVSEGKITEAQKTLLLNKHKEMKAERGDNDAWRKLTPEERRSQMEKKRTELENWAKANGIDTQYLFEGNGMKGHGGFGPRM